MKTLKIIAVALIMIQVAAAQEMNREKKERFESMKIGFITQRLDLTPEEAKVFWPVYNKYSDELEQLRKNRVKNLLNARDNFENMSDADLEKAVDNEIAFRSSEVDIMKKYHPQFKKILPVRKVAKLYKAEEEFKRKLVEMLRERKPDQRGQRPGEQPRDGQEGRDQPDGQPEDGK
jgi:hypothetical protein